MELAEARRMICVALDVQTVDEAVVLAELLHPHVGWFKVGKAMQTPMKNASIFDRLRDVGVKNIFSDNKHIDIGLNTVYDAARGEVMNGVELFNVMAVGGSEMMIAAMDGATKQAEEMGIERPKIIAVTLLTSINAETLADELKVSMTPEEYVVHLAGLAKLSGLDGVVASPLETEAIRQACGDDFIIVTPGIRPAGADTTGQKRLATPGIAALNGANIEVIGRPIIEAPDPVEAARKIAEEIAAA